VEPFKLRWWRPAASAGQYVCTCARPGRSKGKDSSVSDQQLHNWVKALPGGKGIVIISLLGRKNGPSGRSEFSYYSSLYGPCDSPSERAHKLSIQEWLDRWHGSRSIRVIEHPTYDGTAIPEATLAAVRDSILAWMPRTTVVVVDSGGLERTSQVCKYMNLIEDSSIRSREPQHGNDPL
jgi:hypothetical protein